MRGISRQRVNVKKRSVEQVRPDEGRLTGLVDVPPGEEGSLGAERR